MREYSDTVEALYPIIVNERDMTITVKDEIFKRPSLWRSKETNWSLKEMICGPFPRGDVEVEEVNKFYCAQLGPKFNRRFQAANYWLWLGSRVPTQSANLLRQRGKNWKAYSSELVYRANQVLPYVIEAEKDGLLNLVPAIVSFQANPAQIRNKIGGAAWRRIAHNSVTRNKKIMQIVDSQIRDDQEEWDRTFVSALDIPSGVAVMCFGADEVDVTAARVALRKTPKGFMEARTLVGDTVRMVGADFNHKWSYARIKEEHDRATKEVNRRHYDRRLFCEPWVSVEQGFKATRLLSELEVANEGSEMHHCVAAYAREASAGRYVVLKIEGHERATAGYYNREERLMLDQVYGVCNSLVSDECLAFAQKIGRMYHKQLMAA